MIDDNPVEAVFEMLVCLAENSSHKKVEDASPLIVFARNTKIGLGYFFTVENLRV